MREARPITTQNPSVGLYRFATAFAGHREHVALQRQPFASAWPCRHTPFRGFQNVREARPITTQNPSVGLYRFATAFPGHREHVALQRLPFASALALPRGNNPSPSLQVHSIASALPSHRPVFIGFGLAMRVRSSVGFLTLLPTFLVHRAVQMVRYA